MVYSPLSIQVVLSLMAAPTQDQLLAFLKSKSAPDLNALASDLLPRVFADGSASGGPRLSFANGLWVDESISIKPSFKQLVDDFYKAAVKQVQFQTKANEVGLDVNSWAEKETNGLTKDFLPPRSVDSFTKLIFANALYFKGSWDEKFDESNTVQKDFYLLKGTSVKARFMSSYKRQYVSAFDGFKVLMLLYKEGDEMGRNYAMHLILPDAKDGLPALVEKVCSESDFLDRHLPQRKIKLGDFKIPRFKISSDFEASNIIKGLGLVLPFSSGADFTEVVGETENPNVHVSSIAHKSVIEVSEDGTEAAAVSAMKLHGSSLSRSPPRPLINFVADHPFIFLIREEITRTLLFMGQVLNPLAA